jgi:hypothetical protein
MSESSATSITAKQLDRLKELELKIQLTEKQALERNTLQMKRDAKPELSKGAKTFIERLADDAKYGIDRVLETVQMRKGTETESEAIQIYSSVTGSHLIFKNDEYFSNDYIHGTPDVILEDKIVDTKVSWDVDTFRAVKTLPKQYYWQVQGYLWLAGKSVGEVAYVLVNTPEHLFQQHLRNVLWQEKEKAGVLDLPVEMEVDFERRLRTKHNFDNRPFEKRVKVFEIEADILEQSKIQEKVELAREYYNEVIETI